MTWHSCLFCVLLLYLFFQEVYSISSENGPWLYYSKSVVAMFMWQIVYPLYYYCLTTNVIIKQWLL